jgi:hypothetical protein
LICQLYKSYIKSYIPQTSDPHISQTSDPYISPRLKIHIEVLESNRDNLVLISSLTKTTNYILRIYKAWLFKSFYSTNQRTSTPR